MLLQLSIIIATALLSSLFTLGIAYVLFQAFWKQWLYDEMDEYTEIFKTKVKEGAVEAGEELLPEFRTQVREGFKEAMTDSFKGEILERSAREGIKTGTEIMETGLNILLGKPLQKNPGDPRE